MGQRASLIKITSSSLLCAQQNSSYHYVIHTGIHLLWSPLYSRKSLPPNFFFPKNESLVQDGCFYPKGSEAVIVPATDEVCTRYPLISEYFVLISAKTHTKILSNSPGIAQQCVSIFWFDFCLSLGIYQYCQKKNFETKMFSLTVMFWLRESIKASIFFMTCSNGSQKIKISIDSKDR
jgi:hypothetical protein